MASLETLNQVSWVTCEITGYDKKLEVICNRCGEAIDVHINNHDGQWIVAGSLAAIVAGYASVHAKCEEPPKIEEETPEEEVSEEEKIKEEIPIIPPTDAPF